MRTAHVKEEKERLVTLPRRLPGTVQRNEEDIINTRNKWRPGPRRGTSWD
jgi:hypothetical protein